MSDDTAGAGSTAAETVRAYYDALRAGEPLAPFFAADASVVKFGISEYLAGGDEVAAGLRDQTETTAAWSVESRDLRVTERDDHAWFSDRVTLGWAETDPHVRYEFDTRWSGTLERRDGSGTPAASGEWRFVGMHVSTPEDH